MREKVISGIFMNLWIRGGGNFFGIAVVTGPHVSPLPVAHTQEAVNENGRAPNP